MNCITASDADVVFIVTDHRFRYLLQLQYASPDWARIRKLWICLPGNICNIGSFRSLMRLSIWNAMFPHPILIAISGIMMTDLLLPCTVVILMSLPNLLCFLEQKKNLKIVHLVSIFSYACWNHLKLLGTQRPAIPWFLVESSSVHQVLTSLHPFKPNFSSCCKSGDVVWLKTYCKVDSTFSPCNWAFMIITENWWWGNKIFLRKRRQKTNQRNTGEKKILHPPRKCPWELSKLFPFSLSKDEED